MSLSLNGIAPACTWKCRGRQSGVARGATGRERRSSALAGHSNGVEWAVRPNPFDPEGMTHENVSHNLGRGCYLLPPSLPSLFSRTAKPSGFFVAFF